MFVHRRIALVCAIGALALTPGSALAMPATDPPPPPKSAPAVAPVEPVEPVDSGSDTTLALVFSGSALLVAAGAMAVSGYDHRQLSKLA